MDRELDPVYRTIRDTVEAFLAEKQFRLHSEDLSYGSFASASIWYRRGNTHLRFEWDGRDRCAWFVFAVLPSPMPGTPAFKSIEPGRSTSAPPLMTQAQAEARAQELIQRLTEFFKGLQRPRGAG